MKQTPVDSTSGSDFTFDPTDKVVGIIDDANDVKDALRDLTAAGFTTQELELLTDEAGAGRIDLSDAEHEVLVHIFRSTQKLPAFYDAPGLLKRIKQELVEGHYFVAVSPDDATSRERAHEILKAHRGHFINFYGRWAAQGLEP
jgi:hypothetical protein